MSKQESDFLKRLLVTFQGEADERVRSLAAGLIELEKAADATKQAEIVELVFREVHSLKGAARSVNLAEIEAICQAMEDVFAALKRQKITLSLPLLDTLHQATALLKELLANIQSGEQQRVRHMPLIRRLKELARQDAPPDLTAAPAAVPQEASEEAPKEVPGEAPEQPPAVSPAPVAEPSSMAQPAGVISLHAAPDEGVRETLRIDAARLESLLLQIEELISAKLAVRQRAAELGELQASLDQWEKQWARAYPQMRTVSQTLEAMKRERGNGATSHNTLPSAWQRLNAPLPLLLEFLEWNHNWVESLQTRLAAIGNAARRDGRSIGNMIDHLLQDMKQVLMLPLSSILEIFPSVVRDLARQQGKEVWLDIRGAELEVDRRILQEIKDPLMHLVRNCVDHGIEAPEVREARHKPRRGTITLTISQRDSSKFEVLIADDGNGIDLAKVRNTAVRLGLVSSEGAARLSDQEVAALVFQSGLSTSPLITDLSGRGLGLAIVQEKVEKLGGAITLETEAEVGTKFHLLLPLTLATLRGLIVRSEGHSLIVPINHVERVARIKRSEIRTVQSRETIQLMEQSFSLVRLGQALELPVKSSADEPSDHIFVVILSAGEKHIAFEVDEIVGEQEVLMKGLGAQLARVRNIAGATVLGTGQVMPIINVPDLLKSAIRTMESAPVAAEAVPATDKHILLVEDSITARMQLKNILELNGYIVKTAVDGLDALMMLRGEDFDLVVSDIDMPRLNGLDLTARIRSDKKLADLPVILVTTLASRQDQERGIEAGANAYITKSNFDQNKLLDAIRRLI